MAGQPLSPESAVVAHSTGSPSTDPRPRHRMTGRNRLLFFLTAWLIVLMPFLFWWNTWFGRQLSPEKISEYLNDDKHPRHIQHALVQIGERMERHDPEVARWSPELIRLASHAVEEVRNTDAWVMGQDTSIAGFHETLLNMLHDSSPTVRGNAALSLVRYGDSTGRPQIVALLKPATVTAAGPGRIIDADKPGTSIHQGGLIAKIQNAQSTTEVRSPISGRIGTLSAGTGTTVNAGSEVATVEPSADQVWEALRALYLVGQVEDLAAIRMYERELPEIPDRVRQQAVLTEQAIRDRAAGQP
jgi:biotin carboxyl carrier protein